MADDLKTDGEEKRPQRPESASLSSPAVENRKRMLRGFRIETACFALVLFAVMAYGVYVLTPKHVYGVCPMLNLYRQPKNTVDVLVVGTSVAYAGVNTNVLWREYGLACYNLCSAEIPYWSSYYQLREALRCQKPKLILLDAKPVVYSRAYSLKGRTIQSTFGILHPDNRIGAILACQKTLKDAAGFIWAYPEVHKNYKALAWEDFVLPPDNGGLGADWKGYIAMDNIEAQAVPSVYQTGGKTTVNPRQVEYFRKILELAREEGIPLRVISIPNPSYSDELPYCRALRKVAEEYGAAWTEYNENGLNDMLDYGSDFADVHHLNVKGSMKFSLRLGKDLLAAYDLPDRRGDPAYAAYDACADRWYGGLEDLVSRPRKGEWGL